MVSDRTRRTDAASSSTGYEVVAGITCLCSISSAVVLPPALLAARASAFTSGSDECRRQPSLPRARPFDHASPEVELLDLLEQALLLPTRCRPGQHVRRTRSDGLGVIDEELH